MHINTMIKQRQLFFSPLCDLSTLYATTSVGSQKQRAVLHVVLYWHVFRSDIDIRDWDETTPAGPPVLGNTPSEVTTAPGLISNTTSVGVTATRQSKAPVQEEDNPYQTRPSGHGEFGVLSIF